VAELKIIDEECYNVTLKKIIKEQQTSLKSFEMACRIKLEDHKDDMLTMSRIPPSSMEILSEQQQKTAPLGATKFK
jgi:hypothetical protein